MRSRGIDWTKPGRVLSASKTAPSGHVCVWNANVCTRAGKIWYGDLDLTADRDDLKRLARELGKNIYVLNEHDGKFAHEAATLIDKAIAVVSPAGSFEIFWRP